MNKYNIFIIAGVQMSIYTATLTKVTMDDGVFTQTVKLQADEYESLSRIDLNGSLHKLGGEKNNKNAL